MSKKNRFSLKQVKRIDVKWINVFIIFAMIFFAGNQIKTYAQPTIVFSYSTGGELTIFDVNKTLMEYHDNVDEDFNYYTGGSPFHADIDGPTKIGNVAFNNLNIISISGSVKHIGVWALSGAGPNFEPSLAKIEVPTVVTIDEAGCARSAATEVWFPLVETIGDRAFGASLNLTDAEFQSAKTLGEQVFSGCTSLEFVDVRMVKKIPGTTFELCNKLQLVYAFSVEEIEPNTFKGLAELEHVSMYNAKIIGTSAFEGCVKLEPYMDRTLDLSNVTTIKRRAFYNCRSIRRIKMPKITSIEPYAFAGCASLAYWNIGSGFKEATLVEFGPEIFGLPPGAAGLRADEDIASNIELVLGENVLPKPEGKTWNGCTWKSVTVGQTGIKEVINNADVITIYPNPAKKSTTISLELEQSSEVKIVLIDVSGKEITVVYKGFADVGKFHKTFNTEYLQKGIYLLNVSINGRNSVKKLVIE